MIWEACLSFSSPPQGERRGEGASDAGQWVAVAAIARRPSR